jgi:hypothetical protein
MIYLVYQRTVTVPLLLPREKLRATQVTTFLVGLASFPLLALLQAPAARAHARTGGRYGKLWAPGLTAFALFGIPQRLAVWAIVSFLTRH